MLPRTIFAPAKINLGLRITGRYANGYHRLESLFVPVSLYDRLTIREGVTDAVFYDWGRRANRREVALGAQKNPLLWKSIAFTRSRIQAAGGDLRPVCVKLTKRIPSPSGLGGASADAAALIAFLLHNNTKTCTDSPLPDDCIASSSKLGADIPYFLRFGLSGRPAWLCGVGHELHQYALPGLTGWICVPDFGFSTSAMFAAVRERELPACEEEKTPGSQADRRNLALRLNEIPDSDELAAGVRHLTNDFESVASAVFPLQFARLRSAMATVARTIRQFMPVDWLVGMTGSGPGLYALTEGQVDEDTVRTVPGVLRARLGTGWQVYSVKSHTAENIGP